MPIWKNECLNRRHINEVLQTMSCSETEAIRKIIQNQHKSQFTTLEIAVKMRLQGRLKTELGLGLGFHNPFNCVHAVEHQVCYCAFNSIT